MEQSTYPRGGQSRPQTAAGRSWVIGPLGQPLTEDCLPVAGCSYWTPRRKAEVVAAVNGGLLSVDEVFARYQLSVEEFAGWQRAVDRFGMPGLKQTRLKRYRDIQERAQQSGFAAMAA
ncbi:DUF1153 domain-containing protein [Sphingobium nicotianae]|uniref:DUF1153 domain-containing protein n=1 Tax=Sphingobium nicotianae TaxID=2782607 RepID=A0A9X1IRL2_9SPHN|nr:DUF1153 domain-containing protein [Sphingobium nicotianae]MBT2187424.1 DUF1153 domain-containing protein [Sphingobium nicotianae]